MSFGASLPGGNWGSSISSLSAKTIRASFEIALKGGDGQNLDPLIRDQVEWKANDGGRIKVRDLVSLALIPLSKLETRFPVAKQVAGNPSVIFASKGQCVSLFNDLLDDKDNPVTAKVKGDIVEINDPEVQSALSIMKDLPELFDLAYELLPEAYNKVSPGFGRIRGVKNYNPDKYKDNKDRYMRSPAKSHFYQKDVDYSFGEGFIYPVIFGLSAILQVNGGKFEWALEPREFLRKNLPMLMKSYHSLISGQDYGPAKVGKSNGAYHLAYDVQRCVS